MVALRVVFSNITCGVFCHSCFCKGVWRCLRIDVGDLNTPLLFCRAGVVVGVCAEIKESKAVEEYLKNVVGVKPPEGVTSLIVDDLELWERFVNVVKSNDNNHLVFRGQADADWHIKSTLERVLVDSNDGGIAPADYISDIEQSLLAACRGYCKSTNVECASNVELLAMLQHCGCPTRLVDFTYDVNVATWFASHEDIESDFIVYMINEGDGMAHENDESVLDAFLSKQNPLAIDSPLLMIEPLWRNCARAKCQRSVFLTTTDMSICFEEMLSRNLGMSSLAESVLFNRGTPPCLRMAMPLSEIEDPTVLLTKKFVKFRFAQEIRCKVRCMLARNGYGEQTIYPQREINPDDLTRWIVSQIKSYSGLKILYRNWHERYGEKYFSRLTKWFGF